MLIGEAETACQYFMAGEVPPRGELDNKVRHQYLGPSPTRYIGSF
jgi:hypothetical protein